MSEGKAEHADEGSMKGTVPEIIENALGPISEELLTDRSLLRGGTVESYISDEETLHFLFVCRRAGFAAAKLLHPSAHRDVSAGDATNKDPVGDYAAVLAVTDLRIWFLVGRPTGDLKYAVPYEELDYADSNSDTGGRTILVRNDTLVFSFTPDNEAGIDDAITYLKDAALGRLETKSVVPQAEPDSEQDEKNATSYKYDISRPADDGPEKSDREQSDSAAPEAESSTTPGEKRDLSGEGTRDTTGTDSNAEISDATVGDAGHTTGEDNDGAVDTKRRSGSAVDRADSPPNDDSHSVDEVDSSADDPAGDDDPDVPQEAIDAFTAGRGALATGTSPFADPELSYEHTVEAYTEFLTGLEQLDEVAHPELYQRAADEVAELEVLMELLTEYREALTAAIAVSEEGENVEGEPAALTKVVTELTALCEAAATTSYSSEYIDGLRREVAAAQRHRRDGDDETGGHAEEEPDEPAAVTDETESESTEAASDPEVLFEAVTGESAAAVENGTSDTVVLRLENRYGSDGDKRIFTAEDPTGTYVWLTASCTGAEQLQPDYYYRLSGVWANESSTKGRESYRIRTQDGATVEPLGAVEKTDTNAGEESDTALRPLVLSRQVWLGPAPAQCFETGPGVALDETLLLGSLWAGLQRLEIETTDLQTLGSRLETLASQVELLEEDPDPTVRQERLRSLAERINTQRQTVTELSQVSIRVNRGVGLLDGDRTVPEDKLKALRDALETAIQLSESLGRPTGRYEEYRNRVEALLTPAIEQFLASPNENYPVDDATGIQANEVSEVYELIRNLKTVLAGVDEATSDLEEPMREWYDRVTARYLGNEDGVPNYGELQASAHEFSMQDYRDVYGTGERVTEFHTIEVRAIPASLTALIEPHLLDVDFENLYLPVAPESGEVIPVIIESAAGLDRATALLAELPTRLSPAVPMPSGSQPMNASSGADEDSGGGVLVPQEMGTIQQEDDTTSSGTGEDGQSEREGMDGSDNPGEDQPSADNETMGPEAPELAELDKMTDKILANLFDEEITTLEELGKLEVDDIAEIADTTRQTASRLAIQAHQHD